MASLLAGSDVVDLATMSLGEASTFFEKARVKKEPLEDEAAVIELLEGLTFLPLAISQAAAYLNQNQIPIKNKDFFDNTRHLESQNAVATTWFVSFKQIRKSDNAAAELLSFISCIESKAIPQSILPTFDTEVERVTAIGTLCGYNFLVRRGEDEMFDMHRLVHLATRLWTRNEGREYQAKNKAICRLNTVFGAIDADGWRDSHDLWGANLPHAHFLLQSSEEHQTEKKYDLNYHVGRCLLEDMLWEEAADVFEETYRWQESHLPETHMRRLETERDLAIAYTQSGRVQEAIGLLTHVIMMHDAIHHGQTTPFQLMARHSLASAYIAAEQAEEAIETLELLITIQQQMHPKNHLNLLASEHELARAYVADNQVDKAIEILESVVTIEKGFPENDSDRLISEYALACAYMANYQIDKAIYILESVVTEETLPGNSDARFAFVKLLSNVYAALMVHYYSKYYSILGLVYPRPDLLCTLQHWGWDDLDAERDPDAEGESDNSTESSSSVQ
ncbi:putative kinesin light chain 1 [Biscogniauxia marginata]|nr:putative kinesin light chain 1 [Biscogniauxia marginata]